MNRSQALLFLLLLLCNSLFSQHQEVFISTSAAEVNNPKELTSKFKSFELFKISSVELKDQLRDAETKVFNLPLQELIRFQVYQNPLIAKHYSLQQGVADGRLVNRDKEQIAYLGNLANDANQVVSLVVDTHFIYGMFGKNESAYFIEPLKHILKDAPNDVYIVYKATDVIDDGVHTCASDEFHEEQDHMQERVQQNARRNARAVDMCYELELGLASDFSMFQKYGGVTEVENRNIGVVNNVQTNYVGSFDDDVTFNIVEQFVSTCNTCDPWTGTTDASSLLTQFRNWGNSGGFTVNTDNAGLWTDRNIVFQGEAGTIGLAYRGNFICTNNKYHLLEDFTNNANLLRVLQAHEMGHNWGYTHDASQSGFIMAPAVNNTNEWSNPSLNLISNNIDIRGNDGCLDLCGSGGGGDPPTAEFTSNIQDVCEGTEVSFYDQSSGDPTDFIWSFPGGNPSSSTEANPKVFYDVTGTYEVSLTAINADGSNEEVKSAYITVGQGGRSLLLFEDFENGVNDWDIINPDNSFTWSDDNIEGARYGDFSLMIQNHSYSNIGQRDFLQSQTLDLRGFDNLELQVDYAYRRQNNNRRDSLRINVSTNGGQTFTNIFAATETGNGQFATMPDSSEPFFPLNMNQWCMGNATQANCLSLDLNDFRGNENVVIEFENVNGFGNNLFLDNIMLSGTCQSFDEPIADFESDEQIGCAVFEVEFFDLSANDPVSWFWEFPGGSPATSTMQDPVVTYNNPGSYDVRLTVTNTVGTSTELKDFYITVEDLPIPNFDFFEIAPLTYEFENNSSDALTYLWDFGDGQTSTEVNPTHAYDQTGLYTVRLTAFNDCGSDFITQEISIESLPIAEFSADPTQGCTPLAVQFSDNSSSNSDSWFWEFEGGSPSTSTLRNPSVDYFNEGIYDVTLTVTNDLGSNTTTKENYIFVQTQPVADFDFTRDMLTLSFTNNSVGYDQLLWEFGDGATSMEENPSHTYGSDATYTVQLSATNACGTDVFSMEINVSSIPSANFSADITTGCAPLEVQFLDESSDNVNAWNWTFPGGNPSTSNERNPIVNYINPGNYTVELTVTSDAGDDVLTRTDYITVLDEPVAGFNFNVDGNTINFVNTSQNADSYDWDFGDGEFSSEISPSHTFLENGDYLITLTSTNACGSDVTGQTIRIGVTPLASFVADLNSGCAPLTVQFMNQSTGGATDFTWFFEGGSPATSVEENPTVVYQEAGKFNVELRSTNALGTNVLIEEDFIEVFAAPESGFNHELNANEVDFENTSNNATSFMWDFGDGVTSVEENPSHIYPREDNYFVQLIASNECGSDTIIQEINYFISSNNNPLSVELFNVFPNPNEGIFKVELIAKPQSELQLDIVNILGERAVDSKSIDFSIGRLQEEVNMSLLPKGVYILRLSASEKKAIHKRIVIY